ncbi:MAG: pilus assembly protein CpaE [Pseudomonadota bacterium]
MGKLTKTTAQSEAPEQSLSAGGRATPPSLVAISGSDLDLSDEAWLDEELSDEELAALGEEDFADLDLDDEELLAEAAGLLEDQTGATAEPETPYEEPVEAAAPEIAPQPAMEPAEDPAPFEPAPFEEDEAWFDEEASPLAEEAPQKEESDDELRASNTVLVATPTLAESDDPDALTVDDEYDSDVSEFGDEDVDHRPVPRISIHAFCETPTTTELLEKAAVDRRLSKAHMTIHMGGVSKAIDHFQNAPTPNLIIIETVEGGRGLFGQLEELAEVCDPSTKVIIVGRINDIGLYRELIEKGVSDYIVRPKSPLNVIRSIANLYIDPSAPPIGRTIAFVGARGGVGSSTICHNVAWIAAEECETDTIILDLDLPFGTASLDFDQDPTSGLLEALSSPERLDDVLLDRLLQKYTDRLSLFTAPNLLDRDYDLTDDSFETVIDVVRAAAPTIVIDVPHLWTNWSRKLLQTADEIVVTAAPDLASFRNTKNLIDVIAAARPNDASPLLVLNQFDQKASSVPAEQFVEHVGIEPALTIGWEPQIFHAAATNAAPISEVAQKSKTAQGLNALTMRLLGRDEAMSKRAKFSLAGLFKK